MKLPLFDIGTTVLHLASGKAGKVVDRWHDGEEQRYSVKHSGYTWSVPESGLDSPNQVLRPLENRRVAKLKISKLPQDDSDGIA